MVKKISKTDWRLQGQEKYLQNAKLFWKKYEKPRSEWDHDHCEFCGKKFMEQTDKDIINEGYTTEDKYRWICKDCFADFHEMFNWKYK